MSTRPPAAGAPAADPGRRLSLRAVAALLCSVAIFCPPLTVVGPLLGVLALRDMRRDPRRTGRAYALAAIVIGCFFTAAWVGGAWWWHANARTPMLHGPAEALRAGFDGDLPGFRAGFAGPGAAEDQEPAAAAFVAELRRRYGAFIECSVDRQRQAGGAALDPDGLVIPYMARFERADVRTQGRFLVVADGRFVLRFASIVLQDPAEGDLAYPVTAEFIEDAVSADETDQADAD